MRIQLCQNCKYYEGVHNVNGHAPCAFWKIGSVMANDYCSRWEAYSKFGLISWQTDEPDSGEVYIVSIVDDHGDYPLEHTAIGFYAGDDKWIVDNDFVFGTVVSWAKLPDPFIPKLNEKEK